MPEKTTLVFIFFPFVEVRNLDVKKLKNKINISMKNLLRKFDVKRNLSSKQALQAQLNLLV